MTLDREDITAIAAEVVRLMREGQGDQGQERTLQEELEDRRLLEAQQTLSEVEYQILLAKTNALRLERRGNTQAAERMRKKAVRLERQKAA